MYCGGATRAPGAHSTTRSAAGAAAAAPGSIAVMGALAAANTVLDEALAEAAQGAARDEALRQTFIALPTFEKESETTLRALDAFAKNTNPLVTDLHPVAAQLTPTLQQVEIFGKTAGVTGLVMTKLDGTARGGILVALAEKHKLPVHFIGVGEGIEDLQPFDARAFSRSLVGLDAA